MKPTREEVIRVARECGLGTSLLPFEEIGDKGGIWLDGDFNYLDLIERLARHFYEAGAAAAREPLVDDAVRAVYRQVFDSPTAPRIYGLAEQFARAIEQAHGIGSKT